MRYLWTRTEVGTVQLIRCRFIGTTSDAELTDWLAGYEALLTKARDRGQSVLMILDTSASQTLTPRQRRMQGDWNDAHEQLLEHVLLGLSFIVSSVVMRGVITAVLWLKPLPMPHGVFADIDGALQFCLERCIGHGEAVTDAQREQTWRAFMPEAVKVS